MISNGEKMKHSRSGECFSVLGKNKLIMAIEGIPKSPHILKKCVCVCVYSQILGGKQI